MSRYARVLRWTYTRADESLTFQLGLTIDDAAYELRVAPSAERIGAAANERFDDVIAAFRRMTELERMLVTDGWLLESFDAQRVERA